MSQASQLLNSNLVGLFTLGARYTSVVMFKGCVGRTFVALAVQRRLLRGAIDVTRAHSLAPLAERLASTAHRHHHCPLAYVC